MIRTKMKDLVRGDKFVLFETEDEYIYEFLHYTDLINDKFFTLINSRGKAIMSELSPDLTVFVLESGKDI